MNITNNSKDWGWGLIKCSREAPGAVKLELPKYMHYGRNCALSNNNIYRDSREGPKASHQSNPLFENKRKSLKPLDTKIL